MEGRVTGASTDAHVCLVPTTRGGRFASTIQPPRCTSVTPSDPIYRITDVPPGVYWISASADGLAPAYSWFGPPNRQTRQVALSTGQLVRDANLHFTHAGARVSGVVTDNGGAEITGADVQSLATFTTTDATGGFVLWLEPGQAELQVRARGYAGSHLKLTAPGSDLEIQLVPEAILHGRVVDAESGAPVAGAALSLTGSVRDEPLAISASDGRFEIRGLASGNYQPQAVTNERYGVLSEVVTLLPGSTSQPVEIAVARAHTITGRIGTEDGAACEDGRLTVRFVSAGGSLTVMAAKDDALSLAGLPTGYYGFEARCAGYQVEVSQPRWIDRSQDLRWTVARGLAIRGRLLDSSGAPAVHVQLLTTSLERQHPIDSVWTGPNGEFSFTGLYPGRRYMVEAIGVSLVPVEVRLSDSSVDIEPLRLSE